jgi:hypothetical protein
MIAAALGQAHALFPIQRLVIAIVVANLIV